MDISKIKNIIFDLGNVILNVDTGLSEKEFAKLGIDNFSELYSLVNQSELFDLLETGKISPDDFFNKFREITNTQISNGVIEHCWNALLMDYTPARLELLQKLNNKFRTFILSNTNKIHYDFYTKALIKKFNINGLESLVEKAYFSHEIGMKKPDPTVFEFVLQDSDLNPEETLFIDDNENNIIAAKIFKIETIWLQKNNLEFLDTWRNI